MKRLFLPIAFLILLILASCGRAAPEESSAELAPLSIGILPDVPSIPFVVGVQQGFFGDNVNIELFTSAAARETYMHAGGLDASTASILTVVQQIYADIDVVMLSGATGNWGIITHANSGITTPEELQNVDIGLSLNTIIEFAVDMIVEASGGDTALVEKVPIPTIPSRIELLDHGQIHAVAVPEPWIAVGTAMGHIPVATTADLGINAGALSFTREAAETKPEEIRAFYESYNRAVEFINNTDPGEFMGYVIEYMGFPPEAAYIVLPVFDPFQLPTREDVERSVNWLLDKELISRSFTFEEITMEIN